MNYTEALAYLEKLAVFGVRMGLGRIERLLSLLDSPQNHYRTVHVTGTNGKGSVSSMVAGILHASSIRAGLYTSPHLTSYTERIQLDGQPISEQDFADCLSTVKVYVDQMVADGEECPTQFEVLTAVAFFYFAMRHVEYAVIEVGLGGLLDSTNVILPEVSVITNVTLEHADKCGGTLEGVAQHKAGIIKAGTPVVTAAKGEVLDIIRKEAAAKNADIFVAGEDFRADFVSGGLHGQRMEFTSKLLGMSHVPYDLHMLGIHQLENASLAVMTAELLHNLDERITQETVARALQLISWPGRFERLDVQGQMVLIDGAHNPAGMEALRKSLDLYFPTEQRVFLLGILGDKEIDGMLRALLQPEDVVVTTRPDSPRAADPVQVAREAMRSALKAESYGDPEEALERAMEIAGGNRLLVAAGSLYLIGSIRQMLLRKRG